MVIAKKAIHILAFLLVLSSCQYRIRYTALAWVLTSDHKPYHIEVSYVANYRCSENVRIFNFDPDPASDVNPHIRMLARNFISKLDHEMFTRRLSDGTLIEAFNEFLSIERKLRGIEVKVKDIVTADF